MTNAAPLAGLTCAQCRYDLAFAQFEGACPECALPVAQSWLAATESLNRTLPTFGGRVSRSGTLLVVLGVASAFQLGFPPLAAGIIRAANLGTSAAVAMGIVYLVVIAVSGICALVWWVGWLMLCRKADCSLWPAVLERRTPALIGLWLGPAILIVFSAMSARLAGNLLAMVALGLVISIVAFWANGRLLDFCAAVERSACAPAAGTASRFGWHRIRWWLVAVLVASLAAQTLQAVIASFPGSFGTPVDPAAAAANPVNAMLDAVVPREPLGWAIQLATLVAITSLYVLWGRAMRGLGAAIPTDARSYRESRGLAVEPVRAGDVPPPPPPPSPPPA